MRLLIITTKTIVEVTVIEALIVKTAAAVVDSQLSDFQCDILVNRLFIKKWLRDFAKMHFSTTILFSNLLEARDVIVRKEQIEKKT